MSPELTTKRRKSPSEKTKSPRPAPEGDHRKRRRNRTTQSCLHCHTSKRMCDRKRPACSRCTQLGLTGLCVYEVDDPAQQPDSQDESSRLLKRVAELEGVIRELKNKPHPRWLSTSHGPHTEEPHTPTHLSSPNSLMPPMRDRSLSASSSTEGRYSPNVSGFSVSPLSSPSPVATTPPSDNGLSHVTINDGSAELTGMDLSSIFAQGPPFTGYEDNASTHGQYGNNVAATKSPCYAVQPCNCLLDASNYQTMLELSLRLRRAAGVLEQFPLHKAGGYCHLQQSLSELDSLTINTLSSIDSPHHCYNQASALPNTTLYSPHSTSPVQPWLSGAVTGDAVNDSFMSWEPSRRH